MAINKCRECGIATDDVCYKKGYEVHMCTACCKALDDHEPTLCLTCGRACRDSIEHDTCTWCGSPRCSVCETHKAACKECERLVATQDPRHPEIRIAAITKGSEEGRGKET